MTFRIHSDSPADAVEAAYFRIQRERMVDVPILNHALCVSATDFQRWQGHWLGAVVTPWCMSMLLIPGCSENWASAGENKRRFIQFPTGSYAFLGSVEAELGEFQSCALFSPMDKFATQSQATMTARAAMLALLAPPAAPDVAPSKVQNAAEQPSLARRRFLSLRPLARG